MTTETDTSEIEKLRSELEKQRASVAALETKNKELAAEKQKKAKEAEEAQKAADEAAEERAREAKDIAAVEAALTKKFEKQIAELTSAKEAQEATVKNLLIDRTIQSALTDGGALPEMHEALTALFKTQAAISGSGDQAMAVFGDKPLTDHIKSYLGSETGKAFVAAPANSGGGATGGSGASSTVNANSSLNDIMKAYDTNPAAAEAAMAAKEAAALAK